MIICGEETEPLFSLCFLSSPFIFFFLCLFGFLGVFFGGGGGERPFRHPLNPPVKDVQNFCFLHAKINYVSIMLIYNI